VVTLARLVLAHPHYQAHLNDRVIGILGKSAPLHDIGKVGIPDEILRKPGKLTAQEWVIMKTHAELGAQALEMAEEDTQHRVEFLGVAKTIAHWHHENWDGSGYPDGLAGEKIPLAARIMKIADVFDALISRRVYKEAFDLVKVRSLMSEGRATLFDPELLDVFLQHFHEFVAIAQQHPDAPALGNRGSLLV
jgi:putative two-component system response regulator